MTADGYTSRRTKHIGLTPFYLRGRSVNEKMLPGGRQPGMAMGFVADFQSVEKNAALDQQKAGAHHTKNISVSGIPTVTEMIESGFKATFNLQDPKFGLKGYNLQTTNSFEPVYKPPKISINRKDKQDHFTDLEAKLTKGFPPCKLGHVAWEKPPPFAHTQTNKKY